MMPQSRQSTVTASDRMIPIKLTLNFIILRSLTAKSLITVIAMLASAGHAQEHDPQEPVVRDIGSRRELFVDFFLIDRLENASLKLHSPTRVPRARSPLIGDYATVMKDGELYRAVYRSSNPMYQGEQYDGNPGEMTWAIM
jgi:hypothetical protein